MNERIKQLADEAKKYCYETYQNPKSPKWMPYSQMYDKKFAELIVQECAMFVVVELEGQVGSLIADRTANRLEEHFGVKE